MKKTILTLALMAVSCNAYAFPNMRTYGCPIEKADLGTEYCCQVNKSIFRQYRTVDYNVIRASDLETLYDIFIVPGETPEESYMVLFKDGRDSEFSTTTYIVDFEGNDVFYFDFEHKGRYIYVPSLKKGWFQTFMIHSNSKDI